MLPSNPFTPNFGQVPYYLAGRDALIHDICAALDNGGGDPNLSTLLVGARGTGKTALMTYLANEAEQRGWLSANITCLPGMLEDAFEQLTRKAGKLVGNEGGKRISGINIGQLVGVEWENAEQPTLNWRSRMTSLLDALSAHDIGVFITVDEVDPSLDEMISLAATYQHFVREERKAALIMAGLPYRISGLLSDKTASFLRRCGRYDLASIDDADVKQALRLTVEGSKKTIADDALKQAVEAVQGFPFMLQLVGYRAWQESSGQDVVTAVHVEAGVQEAAHDIETRVLRPTLDELSNSDIAFLLAMLPDKDSSKAADIAQRLGKGSAHVSTYRKRLLEQGVIEEAGRNRLRIALPTLREYLPQYAKNL